MSVSPDGKYLALFTNDGRLWVVSTDFQKNLSEFATKSQVAPQQLVWYKTMPTLGFLVSIVQKCSWIMFEYTHLFSLSLGVAQTLSFSTGIRLCSWLDPLATGSSKNATQMSTNDILRWSSSKLCVSLHFSRYSYDEAIFMIPEVDGVRIISSEKCEFLQKVPGATILSAGSDHFVGPNCFYEAIILTVKCFYDHMN